MKSFRLRKFQIVFSFLLLSTGQLLGQTSWTGAVSSDWSTVGNWSNGIPNATQDVVIGDANFTGAFQPTIKSSSACNSLTIGGTKSATLTNTSLNLVVSGNLTINSNGTLNQSSTTITVDGNWINNGLYSGTSSSALVIMAGVSQSIKGSVSTSFQNLTINAGSTDSILTNITVLHSKAISSSADFTFQVYGTVAPTQTTKITAPNLYVFSTGDVMINAAKFSDNYVIPTNAINGDPGAIVEYSSSTLNQTIDFGTYSTLKISGTTTKTVTATTAIYGQTSSDGSIYVVSGTLDLGAFTLDRTSLGSIAGGTFSVSNGATVRIGGSGTTFPANYTTYNMSLGSTIEYYGTGSQVVTPLTYGNLTLTSTDSKTSPSAFTIAGNLTENTGVTYSPASSVTISGNVTLATGSTFAGQGSAHSIGGNLTNAGSFTTTSGSTITFGGPGSVISGAGTFTFNNITFTASLINVSATTNLSVAGNILTTGAGWFTHNSGTGTITMNGGSQNINGSSIILNNLTINSGSTVSTISNFTLTGNLIANGSFNASSDIIIMSGTSKTISGGAGISFSQLSVLGTISTASNITISSALDVSNTGSSLTATANAFTFSAGNTTLNGTVNLFNVILNGTTKLSTNSVFGIAGSLTKNSGASINVTTSFPNTVSFNGTSAQNVPAGTFYNLSFSGSVKTSIGADTLNGDLTVLAGATWNAGIYTHMLYRNFIVNNNLTASTGKISFVGKMDASITGTAVFDTLVINKTSSGNYVSCSSNINTSVVDMTNGVLKMGSQTITITNKRINSGIITGVITLNHAFTTGVDYAFESPYNKLVFTTAPTVTSITETVKLGLVIDFPYVSAISREYDFSGLTGTYSASVYLHYQDNELEGNTKSTMQFWYNTGGGWTQTGSSGYDATNDFVYLNSVSSISPRYTLSGAISVYRWTGSTNTDWNNTGNWTYVQGGSPAGKPGSDDIVLMGDVAFTNQPTISATQAVKTLIFGSVTPSTITIASGGTLTSGGSVRGSWSSPATHTIIAGAQGLIVNGYLILNDGTSGHTINVTSTSGNITVGQGLTIAGDASLTLGTNTLNIFGDFTYTGGTFTPGSSTVNYNGTSTQVVAGVTYNNLIINKSSGEADINSAATINGTCTLTAGELSIGANSSVAGDMVISSGTILYGNNSTLSVGGNWTNNGSFVAGGSTIQLNGAGSESVAATTFNNFIINKSSGTATLAGNISMEGDLTISGGSLDESTYTANRTSPGGTFTMGKSTFLYLAANNIPATYTSYSLDTTSTVTYNGTIAQSIGAMTYGNLTFSNGGSNLKTFAGLVAANGNVLVNSGSSVDGNSNTLLIGGNWTNNGSFTNASGAVLLNGLSKTISGSVNTTFGRLTVYGSYTSTANITTLSTITVATGGSLDLGNSTLTVSGDYTNSGTTKSNGVVTFTGTQVQNIRVLNALVSASTGVVNFNGTVAPVLNSTTNTSFYTVNINNTSAGGINPSTDWTIASSLNVASNATWNGGNHTHTIYGNINNSGTITSTGTLNLIPYISQTITFGTKFSSTGTIIFGGSVSPTFVGTPLSLYNVTISNTSGITPISNWSINKNFTITSTGIFNASSFIDSVYGNVTINGVMNGGTSTFSLRSDTGIISGSASANFYNLTVSNPNVYSGTRKVKAVSDFNVMGTYTNNGVLDCSVGTLRFTGSGVSAIAGSVTPAVLSQVDVAKTNGGSVNVNIDISSLDNLDVITGTLDATTHAITQDALSGGVGSFFIESAGKFRLGGTLTMPTFSLTRMDSLSTVEYYGSTQTVANYPYPYAYGNLIISAAGNKTASGILNIRSNFTLTNGNFNPGGYVDTLGGNWKMTSGTFTSASNTFVLNGAANQDISSTGAFTNVTINKKTGYVTDSANLIINGTLNFIKGNLITGANQVAIGSASFTSATVTGASSATGWVYGKLSKYFTTGLSTTKAFEIGDSLNYTSASINFTTVTTAGTLTASTFTPDHPNVSTSSININKSVNRYYTFTSSALAFSVPTLTLNWVTADNDPLATPANFKAQIYSGGTWTIPTSAGAAATTIQVSNFTSFGDFAIGELTTSAIWTGSSNTSWNTAANWNPASVPSSTSNVTIPNVTNSPILSGGTFAVNNITINASAKMTVTGDKLQVGGAIVNNGTFDVTAGTLELTGNAAQSIPASTLKSKQVDKLIISNTSTSGVTLADSVYIITSLSFGNVSNSILNTGGYLVIKSTATNTGRIGDLTNAGANSGNSISGNVTVQRYIPANGFRGYRFLASSVNSTGSIHANWQEGATSYSDNPHPGYGTHITGTKVDQTNGFDATQTGQSSFYKYDTSVHNYVAFANTNTLTLDKKVAYLLYFRGDRSINLYAASEGSTNTTMRATGTVAQGTQTYPGLGGRFTADSGFNLITNPFASPVNWASIYASNSLINNFFTYYDASLGSYVTVDNSGVKSNGSSHATVEIQSGEAFWIQASTAASPTVNITEAHKSTTNNLAIYKNTAPVQGFYTSLFIDDAAGRRNADGVFSRFGNGFSKGMDANDAVDLENFNENIGISRDGQNYAIEARPMFSSQDTIPLYMSNMSVKNYDLQFDPLNFDGSSASAVLVDNFTGSRTPIDFNQSTVIPFTITSASASQQSNRFYILLNPSVTLPVTLLNFNGNYKNQQVDLNWQTAQEINVDHFEIERSSGSNNFQQTGTLAGHGNSTSFLSYNFADVNPLTGTAFYRLKIVDRDGTFSYSKVVSVETPNLLTGINVYPNPVTGNVINLRMKGIESGNYNLKLVDKLGQVVFIKVINHLSGNSNETIVLERHLAKGTYQLITGKYSVQVIVE